jgi:hypothetical protein
VVLCSPERVVMVRRRGRDGLWGVPPALLPCGAAVDPVVHPSYGTYQLIGKALIAFNAVKQCSFCAASGPQCGDFRQPTRSLKWDSTKFLAAEVFSAA